jgi:hypothetical protein
MVGCGGGNGGGGGTTPPAPPAITTTSPLTPGTVDTAYSITLAATGGTLPYSWSASSLPSGLALSSAGVLSGTPTTAGSSSFTITLTDSESPAKTATLAATLVIGPPLLKIITASPLAPGTVGTAYSLTLAATGGTGADTWAVTTGTLPAGLTLSATGVLSGTPTAAGTTSFTVTVTDSGSPAQTADLAATLVINPPPLAITTISPLPSGTVGVPYTSLAFAATGGTPPYSWAVTAGTLPAGLALSKAGVLSGTPTAAASNSFTVTATDSATAPQTATLAATLLVNTSLTITTASPLPVGTVNIPYVTTLAATGGTSPYVWTVKTGALPPGLALATTGVLSGTPTTPGSSSFTVEATDSETTPQVATAAFVLQIGGPLTIQTTSLPAGNADSPYSAQLTAVGGTPPYVWSVTAGALPPGIVLSATGLLSGTPGSAASDTPTFTVTDAANKTASAPLTLTINAASGTVPDGFYSFVFAGTAPQGTPPAPNAIAMNGTITVQKGSVVGGFFDKNTNTNPPQLEQPITGGSLVLGANGLGQLVMTTATNTMTFALASPASVSTGGKTPIRMIEYDDATGAGSRGSGVIDPATPNPTTAAISGNFAFLLSGTDINQRQQALIGSFQTDGKGNIINGVADANQQPGGVTHFLKGIPGTYSIDANGHGLLVLVIDGGHFHYSFYEVSPSEWLVISLDQAGQSSPLVSGTVVQQAAGPFTTASLPTTSVLQISGLAPVSAGVTKPDITAGFAASDGQGNLTYTFDEYNGTLVTGQTFTVNYTVDPVSGRVVSSGTTNEPILYIIDANSAYLLGPDPSASSGIIEAQTGAPFTNASFSGNYLGGSLPLVSTAVLNESGLVVADGAGNVTFTTNRSTSTGLLYQPDVVGTYIVDNTGRGVITTPDGLTRIFYLVSPTKIAYLTNDTGGYLGSFQQ